MTIAWRSDTTTLAVVGDIHGHLLHLRAVIDHIAATDADEGVDGVLLVGDLGHGLGRGLRHSAEQRRAYAMSLRKVLGSFRSLERPVHWVPGNHDLEDLRGPGNLDHTHASVGGLVVAGIGGSGPDRRNLTYEWGEDDIRARTLPPCDVILSHTPPHDTPLDWVPRASHHAGSVAIRELAEAHEGFLVCGHIHESPGAVQLGDCLCMNVGGLGRPFGVPQVGYIRRSAAGDEAWHVDLTSGRTRRWRREPTPAV